MVIDADVFFRKIRILWMENFFSVNFSRDFTDNEFNLPSLVLIPSEGTCHGFVK